MTLKEWRHRARMSQLEAAAMFGIEGQHKARTLSRYETGERAPPLSLVEAIIQKTAGLVTVTDLLAASRDTRRAA